MKTAEAVEYRDAKRNPILMAAKAPAPGKRRRKKKIRLSLKSSKLKKMDAYSDTRGWSTNVGRTVDEPEKPKGPETIRHQCEMCGSVMKVPKPRKSRYTITCPHCEHEKSFD
jgi:hypothetical protein